MENTMKKLNESKKKSWVTIMELPDDVLQLIKEYSMPLTRPNWRMLRIMPYYTFKYECALQNKNRWENFESNNSPYKEIFNNWWYIYMYNPPRYYDNYYISSNINIHNGTT